jgi:hypothetical protein
MNAQDKVLDRFPASVARMEPAVFQHGIDGTIDGGYWAIFEGPGLEAEELGRGKSETEAWWDAAGLLGNQAA